MKILSLVECEAWMKARVGIESLKCNLEDIYPYTCSFSMPVDTGRKTALARSICHSLDVTSPGLLWITAWGIFPSSENVETFNGYRRSLGEDRDIYNAPGHVFDQADLKQLESIFGLALYFYWDASLFEGTGDVLIRTSHDEYFTVFAKEEEKVGSYVDRFTDMGLKRLAG